MDFLRSGLTMKTSELAGISRDFRGTTSGFFHTADCVAERMGFYYRRYLQVPIEITSKHEFPSLSTETTAENRAIRLSYGLGWGLYWTQYGEAFFKEGHDDAGGWRHYVVCFEQPKAGMLIMTNCANGEDIYSSLLEQAMDAGPCRSSRPSYRIGWFFPRRFLIPSSLLSTSQYLCI
jgi:hypothetical protein